VAAACFVDDIAASTLGLTKETAAGRDKSASQLPSTTRDKDCDLQARDAEIMADFTAWRSSLAQRGFFSPRPWWQLTYMLLEPLLIAAAGCWLMKLTGSAVPGEVLLVLLVVLGSLTFYCAMNGWFVYWFKAQHVPMLKRDAGMDARQHVSTGKDLMFGME